MKTIRIKSMRISNFKGIRSFETEFGDETSIYGYNGLGKSTIADAFSWCLWGKDQQDRKDHEVKNTVDNALNRQDHEVEILFDVDGRHIPIKRVYSEKWTKRRGSNDQEFTGHETALWFDEVPVTLKDFNCRVNDLLDESIFKLVTNPLYFNSLNWKDRRSMLIDMAGEITNEDVAKGNPQYSELLKVLKNKTMDDYRTQITSQRKRVNDELKDIPVKIGEANHNMPEDRDWKALESELAAKNKEIDKIESQIADKSKVLESHYEAEQKRLAEINKLKSKCQNLKWQAEQEAEKSNREQGKELSNLQSEKQDTKRQLKTAIDMRESISGEIKHLTDSIEVLKNQKSDLLEKYHTVNSEEFNVSDDLKCDHCGQELKGDNLEEKLNSLKSAFNSKKQSRISEIKAEGTRIANSITNKSNQLDNLKKELHEVVEKSEELEAKLFDLEKSISTESDKPSQEYTFNDFLSKDYEETKKQIESLEAKSSEAPDVATEDLKARKREIQNEIGIIGNVLSDKAVIEKIKARINELETQERELANKVSELEGIEYTIQQFINDKMRMVEESVNSNFQYVRFKMFNVLINGGTEETCETMLDGVPWSTLNTGGRLKAGIDIINAFSRFYEVHAPMILDNRESVFEIPYTENQVVNLIASEKDKTKLRIETKILEYDKEI